MRGLLLIASASAAQVDRNQDLIRTFLVATDIDKDTVPFGQSQHVFCKRKHVFKLIFLLRPLSSHID